MPHPSYLIMKLPLAVLSVWTIWCVITKRKLPSLAWLPWRFLRWLFVVALVGLAGCSHTEKLSQAKGPLFALNPDHWKATADDLKSPPKPGQQ